MAGHKPGGLLGRQREVDRVGRLIDDARQGHSGVLVVRGEAGIGKTALLDHVVGVASDVQALRAVGVEWEMELPFAALQQLCAPTMDRVDRLPAPQQSALRTAFGLCGGEPPDRFLVGLAVLSLLSGLGAERPVVCVIDDAQWLDQASAQTLAFVARRLLADPVAIVLASRIELELFAQFPTLVLEGLDEREARLLLDSLFPFALDADVRERVIAETRGNPLALLELPRAFTPAQIAGGFALPGVVSVSELVKESFRRRLAALTTDTRRLLLIAAADPVGDPLLLLRAADSLAIGPTAGDDTDGLLEIGTWVRFRHPLVRAAVYQAAASDERRQAHRALAAATDADVDPDRRVWHLAQATAGLDEEVAEELERSAGRAQARGGVAAAAAFLARAAELSVETESRARRALAAAQAKHLAGANRAAESILAAAEAGPLNELQRAQADLVRAQIAYTERRGRDAPGLLLRAAQRLERLDAAAARGVYLDGMIAAHFSGRLGNGIGLPEVAQAARRAPMPPEPAPTPSGVLLDGLATAILDGYAAGAPILTKAVGQFLTGASLDEELHWLWPAAHVSMSLWDDASYEHLSARHMHLGRQTGLLAVLPTALTTRIVANAFFGQLTASEHLIAELQTLADAVGMPMPNYGPVFVAGWRGNETTPAIIDAAVKGVTATGEGGVVAFADYARAVYYNGLGQYQDALDAAIQTDAFRNEGFVIYTQGLVEIVEAAHRAGAPERAFEALSRLVEMAEVTGSDWIAGIVARSRALLSADDNAEGLYREAVERLGRTRIKPQLARAHLLYGEWLRRHNRRVDGREQLRVAYRMLSEMGVEAFAERARRELVASGETVRKRSVKTVTDLTAHEAHIARLAVQGHTNPEIGAQLYISSRTVEWHLRKVFTKLGVGSRRELRAALRHLAPADVNA